MVGNIPHPMADDVYSYINQLLLATVVDDDWINLWRMGK
jgi:hypothetical protein